MGPLLGCTQHLVGIVVVGDCFHGRGHGGPSAVLSGHPGAQRHSGVDELAPGPLGQHPAALGSLSSTASASVASAHSSAFSLNRANRHCGLMPRSNTRSLGGTAPGMYHRATLWRDETAAPVLAPLAAAADLVFAGPEEARCQSHREGGGGSEQEHAQSGAVCDLIRGTSSSIGNQHKVAKVPGGLTSRRAVKRPASAHHGAVRTASRHVGPPGRHRRRVRRVGGGRRMGTRVAASGGDDAHRSNQHPGPLPRAQSHCGNGAFAATISVPRTPILQRQLRRVVGC